MYKIDPSPVANRQAYGGDVAPADSPGDRTHPQALSPAQVSISTLCALKKTGEHNQHLKNLAYDGIWKGTLRLTADNHNQPIYTQPINSRETGPATLSITTQLNERSEYDITEINLKLRATGAITTLTLATPVPSQIPERQPAPHHVLQHKLMRQSPHQQQTPSTPGNDPAVHARDNPTSTIVDDTPLTDELKKSVIDFIKSAGPKLFQHRPEELKNAVNLLRPLSKSTQLTLPDKVALVDVSEQLRAMLEKTSSHYPKAEALNQQIDHFIESGTQLHSAVNELSKQLEHAAEIISFERFMKTNYPKMVTTDGHGKAILTSEGNKNYPLLHQRFKTETQSRYVIPLPSEHSTAADDPVAKIVGGGFSRYQSALREPDNSMRTRQLLLESAQIITALSTAKPETVKKDRIATVFPGGITDPSQLEPGKIYKEDGFVFIGGERPSESGHRMQVEMTKGYPVDARRYYGHSLNSEKKLQWISLPGAEFRFDGMKDEDSRPIYKFSQVDRQS
jgi:hypothetical protein